MRSRSGGVSLAFLDLLSCSLGAMILLFLIFSALEHQGDRNSSATDGLPLEGDYLMVTKEPGDDEPKAPMLFEVSVISADDQQRAQLMLEATGTNQLFEVSEAATIDVVARNGP